MLNATAIMTSNIAIGYQNLKCGYKNGIHSLSMHGFYLAEISKQKKFCDFSHSKNHIDISNSLLNFLSL